MITTKRGNKVSSQPLPKYYSRLYIGFLKQIADQDAKPDISKVDTGLISYDENECENLPLFQKFRNSRWNGMNLKEVSSRIRPAKPGTIYYYSKFTINPITGKYKISMHGKRILNKKKNKA